MESVVLKNVNVRMGRHVISSLDNVTALLDGQDKYVTKVSQCRKSQCYVLFINFTYGILLACKDGFYGRNCGQMCSCIKKYQNRPCNRMNGKCHCLSNYTGLRCEISMSTITGSMETPTQSNRAAIIAGVTVGSAVILLLLTVLVVIIAVATHALVIHVHKTRDVRLRISPSQQFENQTQLQQVTYKPLAPPDEQIPPTEAEMTTEASTDVEITKRPLP